MKKLVSYFLQGLLFVAPLATTIYILLISFQFLDDLLSIILEDVFNITIPGIGVLTLAILLILTGYLGQTIIARPVNYLLKQTLERVPFFDFIYSALKDLFSAFVGKERKFNKPVLVCINKEQGIEKLGFITEDDLSILNETDKVAVYFPHSYNFSGELFIVPKTHVQAINVDPGVAMKFIVSAGITDLESKK
ncbi:DUF502 domain-containing protein [bacterium]|nr:MAG: DUF502 domain-containing protein [bacterium]